MANCTNCGTLVEEGALFCRNCGAKLEAPPVAAPAMEAPVMAPMQGAPITGMPAEPKRKKKFPVVLVSVIAAVLVIAIVVVVACNVYGKGMINIIPILIGVIAS